MPTTFPISPFTLLQWVTIYLCLLAVNTHAQGDMHIRSHTFTPSEITVGDLVQLSVFVEIDEDRHLYSHPVDVRPFEHVEADLPQARPIKSHNTLPQPPADGHRFYEIIYPLRAFAPGEYTLPPITITSTGINGDEIAIQTPPYAFRVQSVRPPNAAGMRDVKPPFSPPMELGPYIVVSLIVIALLVIASVFVYRRRRRRIEVVTLESESEQMPHDLAYQHLQQIKDKNLIVQGQLKVYHIEISQVIRRYLYARYTIPALELTTEDLLQHLDNENVLKSSLNLIQELLDNCDLVKFAKYHPTPAQADDRMREAYQIIDETKAA